MKGKFAVVGCGNWGKNLVRNFCHLLGPERVVCCDQKREVVERLAEEYPGVAVTTDVDSLWDDVSLTAVAIATPVMTHHALARQALLMGKHVFVEKPLAANTADALDLCLLAERKRRVLMVDHLLLFHPAVQELERVIASGELGDIDYLYSSRTNLGIVRSEENVLWSLGPHDLSIMLHLTREGPVQVVAQGGTYLQVPLGIQDVVFVTLFFPGGQLGHLHLSWLDPGKVRKVTIVGSRKMAVFDDMELLKKLRIYDRGIDVSGGHGSGYLPARNGATKEPDLATDEPLTLICQHFLDSIERGHALLSDGWTGLKVVRVLEAAQSSLESNGARVNVRGEFKYG